MTLKVKKFGLRYICNNQNKLSNGSSTDKSKIFDTPVRKIPEKEREAIQSFIISKAENLFLSGNGIHPTISQVGLCEKKTLSSGKELTIVYPAVRYRKIPFPMKNVSCSGNNSCSENEHGEDKNVFKVAMERHQKGNKFYHMFLDHMPTVTKECINSSEYYFEEGLRKVRPYFSVYDSYIHHNDDPGTLGDYMTSLIGEQFREYQKLRVKLGLIYVNLEKATSVDQELNGGDHVSSIIHYHERPVLDEEIKVIYENDNMLVVNKPASMVVHPRTGYRLNSLVYILAKERGYMNLRPIHRIDKLTSGVVIMAKKANIVGALQEELRMNRTKKEYIALVEGRFPSTSSSGIAFNRPLESFKINSVKTQYYNVPKESLTTFHKLNEYKIEGMNGPCYYSLVRCIPFQGRTHQIRLHLMQMGHPIVHDLLYNDIDASRRFENENSEIDSAISHIYQKYARNVDEDLDHNYQAVNRHFSSENNLSWEENLTLKYGTNVPFCLECHMGGYVGQRLQDNDPMFMCLHAWKYEIETKEKVFEAELPKWATDINYINDMLRKRAN